MQYHEHSSHSIIQVRIERAWRVNVIDEKSAGGKSLVTRGQTGNMEAKRGTWRPNRHKGPILFFFSDQLCFVDMFHVYSYFVIMTHFPWSRAGVPDLPVPGLFPTLLPVSHTVL